MTKLLVVKRCSLFLTVNIVKKEKKADFLEDIENINLCNLE